MNRFAYRIHYCNEPRRVGNISMDSEEVAAALGRFRDALPGYMAELPAKAEVFEPLLRHRSAMRIIVHTHLDWAKASVAIAAYADRHGSCAPPTSQAPCCRPARRRRRWAGAWRRHFPRASTCLWAESGQPARAPGRESPRSRC